MKSRNFRDFVTASVYANNCRPAKGPLNICCGCLSKRRDKFGTLKNYTFATPFLTNI